MLNMMQDDIRNTIMSITKVLIMALMVMFSFESCDSQPQEIKTVRHEKVPAEKDIAVNQDKFYYETNEDPEPKNLEIDLSRRSAITETVAQCSPAIVGINVTELVQVEYRDPFFDDPWIRRYFRLKPRIREYQVQGLGSGFLISPDGYILTNHHVAGNASEIIVTTSDGEKYDAKIIGADKISDVALLKIEGKDFPYLELADSDDIIIGEWVIAFGNPFGLFDLNAKPTVTVGVISNSGIDFIQEQRIYKKMIQTDAAISSGNSGGPLVNALGDVIGMNTIIFSTAQSNSGAGSIGIGWAIPINRVKKIIEMLKEEGEVARNIDIGVELKEVNEQIARYLRLNTEQGIVVVSVTRRSLAEKMELSREM
jgi:serine protease Do